jgi:hypothetical protein
MRRLTHFTFAFTLAAALWAQQVVAPTPEQTGSPRGEDKGGYNITNSFETGYRWVLVDGDLGEYRSTVNYGNGVRLLSSSFSMNSRDGHGKYFDQILLNTLGLGNDPYQSAILRIQKDGLYRYDMTWRLNAYYNPGLTTAGGLHLMDTERRIQDHDLTLFPQSNYRLKVGYSRNVQNGPTLSTSQEFDSSGVGLPVFANVRRTWNEYRLGGDGEFAGFRFTVLRRWDFYKEDTPYSLYTVVSAADVGVANDPTVLQQFVKSAPVHGSNPGWLGNLASNRKHWAMNARVSYTIGRDAFALDQTASGISRFGAPTNRQIAVDGTGSWPMFNADLSLSIMPTSRLTVINNSAVSDMRIDGPSAYTEVLDGFNSGTTLYFRYLAIRLVTNSTDASYRINRWLGVYGGYSYTDRLVRTIEGFSLPAFANSAERDLYDTSNTLKSGVAGVRLRFLKGLTANFQGEIGRADHPLTPISDRNYHTLAGRIDYRTRRVQLSTQYQQIYNVNAPVFYSAFSAHSRNYSATAAYSPVPWWSFDASYTKLHLDTVGGIAYFAGVGRPTLQSGQSLYISNIHAGNFGTRFDLGRRADLYLGYTITKDTGDGRSVAAPPVDPNAPPSAVPLFDSVQTFPLSYQSPLARLSVRLSLKMRWNAGYQFYNYHEQFGLFGYYQNFHANTGYTSVTWTF